MTRQDKGVPASPSRCQPSASAANAAPQSGIANAVFVVIRSVGCYERTETPIRAFMTAKDARAFVRRAEVEWWAAESAVIDRVEYPADGATDEEWEKWARRRKRQWARFRSFLKSDKAAGPVGEWSSPEDPSYYYQKVPLTASAAGARSDETAEQAQPEGRQSGDAKQRDAQGQPS